MATTHKTEIGDEILSSRVSEQRMNELLDIAAEVFFEHGFAAASVGEMARRARASKGTYYSRFPTKADLFEAMMQRKADLAFPPFQALLEAGHTLPETLHAFSNQLLELTLSDDSISLIRLLYMESRNFPELGRSLYEHGIGRIKDALIDFLRQQVRSGALRIEAVPIAAEQLTDGLIGEPIRRLALGISPDLTKRELDVRVKIAVQTFLQAYSPRE